MGRRGGRRSVRLDRAQPRRRGRRRRAPTSSPPRRPGPPRGKDAGRVYVYSTKTGKLLWKADGAAGDQLGTGVELAGDANRDGVPDVVAGAPGGGKAYVYSGKDGRVLLTLTAEDEGPTTSAATSPSAGDVDHDGYDDVLVGAPSNAAGGKDAGRAYVYSGKDGRMLADAGPASARATQFGSTVAGYTNGKDDLPHGRRARRRAEQDRARLRLRRPRRRSRASSSSPTRPAPRSATCSCRSRATSTATASPDLYATDFANAAKGPSTGRAYVFSGKTGKTLLTLDRRDRGRGIRHRSRPPRATSTATAVPDLIIGAWQYGGAAVSGGRAYLYSGKDGKLLKTYTCRIPGDTFGFDAVGMGDTDGDGTVDFLITSAWSGIHGNHSGRVFLISSGVRRAGKG